MLRRDSEDQPWNGGNTGNSTMAEKEKGRGEKTETDAPMEVSTLSSAPLIASRHNIVKNASAINCSRKGSYMPIRDSGINSASFISCLSLATRDIARIRFGRIKIYSCSSSSPSATTTHHVSRPRYR
jgi:hypothetical protein